VPKSHRSAVWSSRPPRPPADDHHDDRTPASRAEPSDDKDVSSRASALSRKRHYHSVAQTIGASASKISHFTTIPQENMGATSEFAALDATPSDEKMERVPGRSPRAAPLAVNVGGLVVAGGLSANIRMSTSEARLRSG
jgi:hypothetical protein